LPLLFIHKLLLDCGAVQADALTVDRLALMEKYFGDGCEAMESILATEIWLNSIKYYLVVSDVVPVACRATAVTTSHEIEITEVQNNVETKLSEEETDCILLPEDDHPGLLPVDESVHVEGHIFSSTTTVGLCRKACHHHYKASVTILFHVIFLHFLPYISFFCKKIMKFSTVEFAIALATTIRSQSFIPLFPTNFLYFSTLAVPGSVLIR